MKRSAKLSDALGSAGSAVLALTPTAALLSYYVNMVARARAAVRFRKAMDRSREEPVGRNDVVIRPYSHNKLSDKLPTVFDDEEKAVRELHPDYDKRSRIRKFFLKLRIGRMLDNPQFRPDKNSVFLRPSNDARVLAHELGHAEDNRLHRINLMERLPLHYKSIVPTFIDPENTPLMRQERNAWDYGGVHEGDYLREAALDTYREQQKSFKRPIKALIGGAALGGMLIGSGLVARKFE